jgi:hypothetical protein
MRKKHFKNRKLKNSEEEEEKIDFNDNLNKILLITLFSLLLLLSWLSLKWLYEDQMIFTFHRYINLGFSIYFPIQVSSFVFYLLTIIMILLITISSKYYIINNIINLYKKENVNNKSDIIPKAIYIPIFCNSLLILLGKITYIYYKNSHYFYYVGLCICCISFFSLLKLNLNKQLNNIYFQINCRNSFLRAIYEDYLFNVFLVFDFYYLFYVICQIIVCYTNNLNIEHFLGITANLFFGIVSVFIIFELKSINILLLIFIIFAGIEKFQFTIRAEEREEINLGNGELILSCFFLICFFIESIYIIIYKCQNKN